MVGQSASPLFFFFKIHRHKSTLLLSGADFLNIIAATEKASLNAWTLEASPSYIFIAFPDRVLKFVIWSFARKKSKFYSKDRSQQHIIWIVFSYPPYSFFILLWIVVVSVRHLHSWVMIDIVALDGIFFRLVNNAFFSRSRPSHIYSIT